jgi:putative GTP pyrophosphokinase
MIRIGPSEEKILYTLTNSICDKLDSSGIFNRVFSRIKSKISIEKKIEEKKDEYIKENRKMQDVFGIRVTLYFLDDEKIAIEPVKSIFQEMQDSHSIDPLTKDHFGPLRNNLIFKLDQNLVEISSLFDHEFIDTAFEVQFRTIFSEGWHEVEHDFRYKCKKDWENENILSRQLNGQLAVLETSDWAILKIFDELAYKKYKAKEWNSFFRNILRIRFEDTSFSEPILELFNKRNSIGKELLKHERAQLVTGLMKLKSKIPLKMDNVLFIINRFVLKDIEINQLESSIVKDLLEESFPTD